MRIENAVHGLYAAAYYSKAFYIDAMNFTPKIL